MSKYLLYKFFHCFTDEPKLCTSSPFGIIEPLIFTELEIDGIETSLKHQKKLHKK